MLTSEQPPCFGINRDIMLRKALVYVFTTLLTTLRGAGGSKQSLLSV
jgi:hypothetical protein